VTREGRALCCQGEYTTIPGSWEGGQEKVKSEEKKNKGGKPGRETEKILKQKGNHKKWK